MLLATLWMSVCFGAVMANRAIRDTGPPLVKVWSYVTFYAGFTLPFVAVGALFGRARDGLAVGIFVATLVFSYAWFAITFFANTRINSPAIPIWVEAGTLALILVGSISYWIWGRRKP